MCGIYYYAFRSLVFDVPSNPFLINPLRPSVKICILFKSFQKNFFKWICDEADFKVGRRKYNVFNLQPSSS